MASFEIFFPIFVDFFLKGIYFTGCHFLEKKNSPKNILKMYTVYAKHGFVYAKLGHTFRLQEIDTYIHTYKQTYP
jgi:hypothetical protein